jgi:predicted transcriptional regulator of viral defense system
MNALTVGMRQEMRSHHVLAAVVGRQYGLVTSEQLRGLGFSDGAARRMAKAGRLHRLHRGVYALGNPTVSEHTRCLAAVLACGRDALLSHTSAAWLWGLQPSCPRTPHVTVPARGQRRTEIQVHHALTILDESGTVFERIPVTRVPRTLLDLADTVGVRALERAIDRAERRGLLDMIEIDAMLARRQGNRGTQKLRRALGLYRDPVFNRARSERLFLKLVKRAGLPRPAIDYFVAGYEVDVYWEQERFAIEVDGWETHQTRRAFELDRLRQEDLKLAGIDSILLAARRMEREPKAVGERLRRLLAERRQTLGLS